MKVIGFEYTDKDRIGIAPSSLASKSSGALGRRSVAMTASKPAQAANGRLFGRYVTLIAFPHPFALSLWHFRAIVGAQSLT